MMSNMNPNEIKKALECRGNCNSNECSECPYRMGEYLCDIVTSAKDALAYINQLEAENKGLKSDVITLKHSNGHLKTKYDEIMALSKRLMQKLIKAREQFKTARLESREDLVNSLKGKARRPFVNYYEPVVLVSDIDNLLKDKDGEN